MRLLPDMDLARIGPLPADQKRAALERMKEGRPPFSYDPLRKNILDILNVQAGPLAGEANGRTPWSLIESNIVHRAVRGAEEVAANIGVARALYDLATAEAITGRREEFFPLQVGIAQKISFWSPAVIRMAGRAVVPFIDPRRAAKNLTVEARRFVFSTMHERIRAADPDFADVGLCIVQFGIGEGGVRLPKLFTDAGVELFSFDELDGMVRETYAIWADVLAGRDQRNRGTGTDGPLFGGS